MVSQNCVVRPWGMLSDLNCSMASGPTVHMKGFTPRASWRTNRTSTALALSSASFGPRRSEHVTVTSWRSARGSTAKLTGSNSPGVTKSRNSSFTS